MKIVNSKWLLTAGTWMVISLTSIVMFAVNKVVTLSSGDRVISCAPSNPDQKDSTTQEPPPSS